MNARPRDEPVRVADLIAIELMRLREGDRPQFRPEIDQALAQVYPERPRRRHDAAKLLADRALRVLDHEMGLSRSTLLRALGWASTGLWVAVALVALVLMTGIWLSRVLGADAEGVVSIQGFMLFVAFQTIMLVPHVLLTLGGAFTRPGSGHDPGVLSIQGLIATFVAGATFLIRRLPVWVLNRSAGRMDQRRWLTRQVDELLDRQGRQVTLLAASLSNGFWLMLICGVLLTAWWNTTWERYDYRWQSSYFNLAQQAWVIDTIGRPAAWLVELPDEQAVRWLAQGRGGLGPDRQAWLDQQTQPPDTTEATAAERDRLWEGELARRADLEQEFRATWTKYLLALLVVYGLLPRLALFALQFGLRWLFARDLWPRTDLEYFRETIRQIYEPPIGTESPDEPEAPAEPVSSATAAHPPVTEPPPVAESSPTAIPPEPPPSPAPPPPTQWWVVSYEVPPPASGWPRALQLPSDPPIEDCGQIATRQARHEFLKRLAAQRDVVARLIVVADVTETPDHTFQDVLGEMTSCLADQEPPRLAGRMSVVLTELERLRKQESGQAEGIARRVEVWRSRCERQGVPPGNIWEFDHNTPTAEAQARLAERWRDLLLATRARLPQAAQNHDAEAWIVAGRFPQAAERILSAVETLRGDEDAETLQRRAAELNAQLTILYREQTETFLARARQWQHANRGMVEAWSRQIAQAVPDVRNAAEWAGPFAMLNSAMGHLRSRWAVAGGSLGLMLGVGGSLAALPVLPLAALPALATMAASSGAVGGAVGTLLGARASALLGGKSRSAPEDPTADEDASALSAATPAQRGCDELARGGILWALVLELQGNTAKRVASGLARATESVGDELLDDAAAVQQALGRIQKALRTLAQDATHEEADA